MENKIYIEAKKLDDFLIERKTALREIMKEENPYQQAKTRGQIDEIETLQIVLMEHFGLKNWFKTK